MSHEIRKAATLALVLVGAMASAAAWGAEPAAANRQPGTAVEATPAGNLESANLQSGEDLGLALDVWHSLSADAKSSGPVARMSLPFDYQNVPAILRGKKLTLLA